MYKKITAARLLMFCMLVASLLAGCREDESAPDRDPKTLLIGDSLFYFWGEDITSDLEGVPNLVNIAEVGTTSIDWMEKQEQIRQENPTTVLVSLGTNDIGDLKRSGEATAKGGDEYGACLQNVLKMIHETVPDAHIYCLTINICGEEIRWNLRNEIKTCNKNMRKFCRFKKWVERVDTEYAFYDDNNYEEKPNPAYFWEDYIHFSREGYERFSKILRDALKV